MDFPPPQNRLPSDKDEIERLMEVHEDFREYIESRRRQFRFKLRVWLLFLLIVTLFAFLETTRITRVTRTLLDYFKVSHEERPHDGKMLPMNLGGRASLLIAPEEELAPSPRNMHFPAPSSASKNAEDAPLPRATPSRDPS